MSVYSIVFSLTGGTEKVMEILENDLIFYVCSALKAVQSM